MKLTSPHRLSPSLMLAAAVLAVASSGPAIAAAAGVAAVRRAPRPTR